MVNSDGAAAVTRIKKGLRSWMAERRLRGKMADLSEQLLFFRFVSGAAAWPASFGLRGS